MTIHQAIVRLDALKYNTYTDAEKRAWLTYLDGDVYENILKIHEPQPQESFTGYDESTPGETQLLVPAPFDDMYLYFLEAMIDYNSGELARFNNSNALYRSRWVDFSRHYNRTHLPVGQKTKFF